MRCRRRAGWRAPLAQPRQDAILGEPAGDPQILAALTEVTSRIDQQQSILFFCSAGPVFALSVATMRRAAQHAIGVGRLGADECTCSGNGNETGREGLQTDVRRRGNQDLDVGRGLRRLQPISVFRTWRCAAVQLPQTGRCHGAVIARGGMAIVPIRRNGRAWKEDCPAAKARNEILRATHPYGRAIWKRWTGYHASSRMEAKPLGTLLRNALPASGCDA